MKVTELKPKLLTRAFAAMAVGTLHEMINHILISSEFDRHYSIAAALGRPDDVDFGTIEQQLDILRGEIDAARARANGLDGRIGGGPGRISPSRLEDLDLLEYTAVCFAEQLTMPLAPRSVAVKRRVHERCRDAAAEASP